MTKRSLAAAIVGCAPFMPMSVGADCPAPAITYDGGPVARGARIHVVGTAWGDACHDTGPPPEGEGPLGNPLDGIVLVVVQGADEHVVARGAAGERYDFEVEIVVPAPLRPGAAELVARSSAGAAAVTAIAPVTITVDPPVGEPGDVAQFGAPTTSPSPPSSAPTTSRPALSTGEPAVTSPGDPGVPPEATSTEASGWRWAPWLVGATGVLAAVLIGARYVRRRQP